MLATPDTNLSMGKIMLELDETGGKLGDKLDQSNMLLLNSL